MRQSKDECGLCGTTVSPACDSCVDYPEWRTGDPPDEGYYLVTDGDGEIDVAWSHGDRWDAPWIRAWMPLPEPYRGEGS